MLKRTMELGFTLIELMVGLAIFAFLMVMGAPSFATWVQNSHIRTATEAIQNGIHLARAEAVRRNMPVRFQLVDNLTVSCALSTSGRNWVVSLDSAAGNCDASPTADLAAPTTPRIIQVRAGSEGSANAVVAADQSSITFNGLGRATGASATTVNITNPTGGSCYLASGPMRCMRIVVSAAGQVRLCDPFISLSSDAQGC